MAEAKVTIRAIDEASSVMKSIQANFQGLVTGFKAAIGFEGLRMLGDALKTVGESMVHFVVSEAEMVKELENLSAQSGVTTKDLQVLEYAFRANEIPVESLQVALKFLNKAIADNDPTLKKLGVTSRDTFTALLQAAQGIAAISDPADRARETMEVFGSRGGVKVIPVLLELAKSFGEVSRAATDTGNVISDQGIAKIDALEKSIERLKLHWEGFWKQAAVTVADKTSGMLIAAEKVLSVMERIAKLSFAGKLALVIGGETQIGGSTANAPVFGPGNAQGIREFLLAQAAQKKAALEAAAALQKLRDAIRQRALTTPASKEELDRKRELEAQARGIDLSNFPNRRETDFERLQHDQFVEGQKNLAKSMGGKVPEPDLGTTSGAEEIIRNVRRVQEAFAPLRDAIMFGFSTVFTNLSNKMQTFASAAKTLFDSIVAGIEQMVGQLLASEAVKALFKLLGMLVGVITGNPALGEAVGRVGGAAAGDVTVSIPAPTSGPAAAPVAPTSARSGGDTFVIQTLSPRDVLGELLSPAGSMRTANSRLSEIAAASR